MTYIVQEYQTTDAGVTSVLPATTYSDRYQAESAYHTILAAAAVSQVAKHGAIITDDNCHEVISMCYYHQTPVQGET